MIDGIMQAAGDLLKTKRASEILNVIFALIEERTDSDIR